MEKEIGIARGMVTQKGNYFFSYTELDLGITSVGQSGRWSGGSCMGSFLQVIGWPLFYGFFMLRNLFLLIKKKMEIKYGNMTNDIFMLLHSIISFRHFFVASDLQF